MNALLRCQHQVNFWVTLCENYPPMTPDEKLNHVLEAFIEKKKLAIDYFVIYKDQFEIEDEFEAKQILQKLDEDKRISCVNLWEISNSSAIPAYSISFNGNQFLTHGGYVQQQKDIDDKRIYDFNKDATSLKLSADLSRATWALVFVTAFLLIVATLSLIISHC